LDARVECGLPPYPVPCAIVGVGGSAWIVDRRSWRVQVERVQVRLRGGTFIGSRRSNGIRRVCVLFAWYLYSLLCLPTFPPL